MILGFKTTHQGKLTHFVQKILACVMDEYKQSFRPKPHTIREGKRWKAGMTIHMAIGVRTKNYFRFNENIAGLQECISVQDIVIKWPQGKRIGYAFNCEVFIDGKKIEGVNLLALIWNDGFDENIEDFYNWFNKDFEGQIIHWTDLKY